MALALAMNSALRGLALVGRTGMGLTILLEQFAPDQHAANLAGAGPDLVKLGIAPEAAGRINIDIAVAAEGLDCLTGHPGGLFGCIENRPGGILARSLAAIAGAGDGLDIGFGGIHGD